MKKLILFLIILFSLASFSFAESQYTIKRFEMRPSESDPNSYEVKSSFEKKGSDGVVTKDQRTRRIDKKDLENHRMVFNDDDADFKLVENDRSNPNKPRNLKDNPNDPKADPKDSKNNPKDSNSPVPRDEADPGKEATRPNIHDPFDEDFSYTPREVYDNEEFYRDFDEFDEFFNEFEYHHNYPRRRTNPYWW